MTTARRFVVLYDQDAMYHCVSRCVRRAFLCGFDRLSQKSFDHRKLWIRERMQFLASVFSIEVLAYALMSNHVHILLRTRCQAAAVLDDEEVVRRWLKLYPKQATGQGIAALLADKQRIDVLRGRIASVSWFMKALNEYVARRANQEDECKGRFWEGRFRCQRLEDEAAALTCAVYIDLNPVRAAMAVTPEDSEYTSAWERIGRVRGKLRAAPDWLAPIEAFLNMRLIEYLAILDWTGREFRAEKRGAVPRELAPILYRLGLDSEQWLQSASHYDNWFYLMVGSAESLISAAREAGKRWYKGLTSARKLFGARVAT